MSKIDQQHSGVFYIDHALKQMAWERAKGELRALIQIKGSYSSDSSASTESDNNWRALEEKVNEFIKDIEDNALQE